MRTCNYAQLDLKILYVGPLQYGGTCLQRKWALEDLGCSVVGVDTGIPEDRSPLIKLGFKVRRRVFPDFEIFRINKAVISTARTVKPDIVWIDKGLAITSETLQSIKVFCPQTILVSFSPDDMLNPNNQTEHYLNSIPLYDHHITTKTYNVKELQSLGAHSVLMMDNSYCRRSHNPVNLTPEQRLKLGAYVGFIGFWEQERDEYISFLAESDIPVRVWGPWKQDRKYPPNMLVEGRTAWGDDYAPTLCAFDINLCFLRKENRDLQTTRSVEIPACGTFMLAERTDEHLSLFKEGEEAEFFDSKEEMRDKVTYYLQHEDLRRKIALAGYNRCQDQGYSYTERFRQVIKIILRESHVN
ncbi:MAG: glycosyltransferase [Desulfuromonadaceae bacterium]|nr:glycosyltransferase [Desulfuromonadaceae bacterium]